MSNKFYKSILLSFLSLLSLLSLLAFSVMLFGLATLCGQSGIQPDTMSSPKPNTTKYTVYFFLGEDCKICQYYTPVMNELSTNFASDSISFVGMFPTRYSTKKGIADFRDKYDVNFPLKREYYGTKTRKFGVKITPEVVIYDNIYEEVLYKGRIDNSYVTVGRRRQVVTESELKWALNNILEGDEIKVKESKTIGCYITLRQEK